MYYVMRASAPSLHRESTDSLIHELADTGHSSYFVTVEPEYIRELADIYFVTVLHTGQASVVRRMKAYYSLLLTCSLLLILPFAVSSISNLRIIPNLSLSF